MAIDNNYWSLQNKVVYQMNGYSVVINIHTGLCELPQQISLKH